eukprot:sb/3461082/
MHYQIAGPTTPVTTIRDSITFHFSLLYVSSENVVSFLQQLNRASTLHFQEHTTMIAMIAHHRQSLYPFKSMFFDDLYEQECGNFECDMVEPLVNVPGRIVVSKSRLYFQPFHNAFSVADILKWKLDCVRQVIRRTYSLRPLAIEVFLSDNTVMGKQRNYLFVLTSETKRDTLYDILTSYCSDSLVDSSPTNMTLKWQNGSISNFEYLLYLNNISDRTSNNLSQYPVFPWVLTDYTSPTLNLDDPGIYRDLSKPIGALNPSRLEGMLERYREMPDPKFLYGSHYSTPGFITYYLMRSRPDLMLCLMGGKFDHPDRLFIGVEDCWRGVTNNTADFKELIPEFYEGDGSFLENKQRVHFGKRQNGAQVESVVLPPWASSPQDFVEKMRSALESDHVSSRLHHWIDLIFGYKQRGAHAEQAHNVFHHLCYPGSVDLGSITNPTEAASIITQIQEFGQVPTQIFTKPHPERRREVVTATLTVGMEEGELVVDEPEEQQPSDRRGSVARINLCNFTRSQEIPVKNHVTFFLECGQLVFVGSASGMIFTYRLPEMKYAFGAMVSNVSLTCVADLEHSLCVGSADGKCYFLTKQQGTVYLTFPAHFDTVTDMLLVTSQDSMTSHNDDVIFTSSWDASVRRWMPVIGPNNKIKSLKLLTEYDHDEKVMSLAVLGEMLYTCSGESIVTVWGIESGDQMGTVDYSHHDVTRLLVWQERLVLVGLSIVLGDPHTAEEMTSKRLDSPVSGGVQLLPRNQVLICDNKGRVTLVDLLELNVVGELETDIMEPSQVSFVAGQLLLGYKMNAIMYSRNKHSFNEYYMEPDILIAEPPPRQPKKPPPPARPRGESIPPRECRLTSEDQLMEQKDLISAAPFPGFSRLKPGLEQCLSALHCLPYFIQYLEYCKSVRLLHFLFACDTFTEASERCHHGNSVQCDALDIYSRFISMNSTHAISLPENVRRTVENNISPEDGKVDCRVFEPAITHVKHVLTDYHVPKFLRSSYCTSAQLELCRKELVLADVLLCESAIPFLMEYLEYRSEENHVLFWVSVEAFQEHLRGSAGSASVEELGNDAIALYDTYLSLQARKPVNYGRIIRGIVESSICPDNGIITPDAFLIAQQYCYHYMNKFFFESYLKSDQYKRYLNELRLQLETRRREERTLRLNSAAATRTSAKEVTSKMESLAVSSSPSPKPAMFLPAPPRGDSPSSSKASSPASQKRNRGTAQKSPSTSKAEVEEQGEDILDDRKFWSIPESDYTLSAVDEWGVYQTQDRHLLNTPQGERSVWCDDVHINNSLKISQPRLLTHGDSQLENFKS